MTSIRYTKRQTILVGSLSLQTGLALVPQGLYVNKKLDKAEKGTLLIFQDTWRKTHALLASKCRINLNTAAGSFVIRYAFPNKTLADLTAEWDAVCLNEGYMTANSKSKAYSLDNVLLFHVREFIKEILEAEEHRKQEIAEAIARQAEEARRTEERQRERERLMELAKNGIYQHPDIL